MKKLKSLLSIPIKVEMQPVEHVSDRVITVDELSNQIEEARKGKAKVDSKYVGYNQAGHLFEYKFDYVRFLDNMSHIIKEAKNRPRENRYKSDYKLMLSTAGDGPGIKNIKRK
jgi:hypothetical protein